MGGVLKVLLIVVAAIVLLVAGAVLFLTVVFDPNDYRDEIIAAVNDATGRELTLEGDLELEVFPSLRIAVGPAAISNAPGFGEAPFARIGAARLQLALLPLLSRRIEIGEARLEGLVLNLARNAQGRNNWQDLAEGGGGAAPQPEDQEAQAPASADLDLDIAAIEILNASVNWSDAASGSEWQLSNFNMNAEGFGPGQRFPLDVSFELAGEEVEVAVAATTQATLALAENRYQLDDLRVELSGEGPAWPGGGGQAALRFASFVADLQAETLDLRELQLQAFGLTATGNLQGRQLFGNLALAGDVVIQPFDPRDVLETFRVELATADPQVMSRADARARLVYDNTQMMLEDMQLSLDDSQLTGRAGFRGETLSFDLGVDEINLDRYLPPAAEGEAAAEDEGSLDEVDLPLEVLRTLDAAGALRIGQARFAGMALSDVAFSLQARNGRLILEPQAALYGGRYSGNILVEVQNDAARMRLQQQLQNVALQPLGRDLLEMESVSGTGSAQLDLTATGSNLGVMRRGLDGSVSFTLTDGAWEGFDMWYELRRAKAVLDRAEVPARPEGPRRTPFSQVSASGVVEDAILTNRDLSATLQFMTLEGAGTVNLLTDAIDFDLVARFVEGPGLEGDPLMASLAGGELPLEVGGTLSEPSVRPNFGAVVRQRVQEEVEEEVEQRLEERRDEVRDRLQERLRGIFDR